MPSITLKSVAHEESALSHSIALKSVVHKEHTLQDHITGFKISFAPKMHLLTDMTRTAQPPGQLSERSKAKAQGLLYQWLPPFGRHHADT